LDETMRSGCLLLIALCFVILPAEASPQASGRCDTNQVSSALRELASEKAGGARFEKSMILADRIEDSGPVCVTASDIEVLTNQLRDEDDSVRGSAAAIIGSIGPAARAAIPALERALAERPCENRNLSSAGAIRVALKKLGENPPEVTPFSCRNSYR
jgi:hypothetical protein